jgi:hypothetical protein
MADTEKYARTDQDILAAMGKPGRSYLAGLGVTASLAVIGGLLWVYQIRNGPGLRGIPTP